MAQERVRDIMTSNPETCRPSDLIRDVARIMADRDTGVVPVIDDSRKIIGLITDRDIVVRLVAEGKDPAKAHVNDAMTKSIRSVKEDTPLDEVTRLMSSAQIRRVPVVNQRDEIIGIVSVGDIATETGDRGKVGHTIEKISEGSGNN